MSDEVEFLLYDALPCTLIALGVRWTFARLSWLRHTALLGFLAGILWHLYSNRWPFLPSRSQWQWLPPAILVAGGAGFLIESFPHWSLRIRVLACCGISLVLAPWYQSLLFASLLFVDQSVVDDLHRRRAWVAIPSLTIPLALVAWIAWQAPIASIAGLCAVTICCMTAVLVRADRAEGTILVGTAILVGSVHVLNDRVLENLPGAVLLALAPAVLAGLISRVLRRRSDCC